METMTKHRSHSAVFKRQVAEEFIAGETLHALSRRHDISRRLIRIWVGKFEAGALDDDVQASRPDPGIRGQDRRPGTDGGATSSSISSAFALRYCAGKRVRDADEVVATIAARRIVEHLRAARYRV